MARRVPENLMKVLKAEGWVLFCFAVLGERRTTAENMAGHWRAVGRVHAT